VAQLFVELQSRDGRISDLEHRMSLLLRKLYGSTSEKLDPRQASLFDLLTTSSEDQQAAATHGAALAAVTPTKTPSPQPGTGHGRRRLPDQLQRREVVHDLTDVEKEALGGADHLVVIGREVTEQLEWEPSCTDRPRAELVLAWLGSCTPSRRISRRAALANGATYHAR
jgi:hypothetical protein